MMRKSSFSLLKVVGLVGLGIVIGAAVPGPQPMSAKEAKDIRPPKIGYVNGPKVLREFKLANQEGKKITEQREAYVAQAKTERDTLERINQQLDATDDGQRKQGLQKQALAAHRRLEAIDKEAQGKLTELSNTAIVAVYERIRDVIAELAKDRDLDVVEMFPAASIPAEERTAGVAKLMLQTPALIPFYMKPEFDLTAEVIERLNKKYPEK